MLTPLGNVTKMEFVVFTVVVILILSEVYVSLWEMSSGGLKGE